MLLALDVGNTQIFGGVFEGDDIRLRFRKSSRTDSTSDETGICLRAVLRENGLAPEAVKDIAVCSVVPDHAHSLRNCCLKYFQREPFILQPGVKTGLNIKYKNPAEVGADRIANAIGAVHLYPGRNLMVADFGTATTLCAITKAGDYLGGVILAGLRISMEALAAKTAQLRPVEIVRPAELVGRSTAESIQSGLFYGHALAVRALAAQIREKYFRGADAVLLGTGGFSRLFENEGIFDALLPDLVLTGLNRAFALNRSSNGR